MIWSFSAFRSFQKCPRQWFFKNVVANSRAKDPLRREAYRLSKLEGIQSWRGKIVDTVISDMVIPSIIRGQHYNLPKAKESAQALFEQQKTDRMAKQLHGTAIPESVDKGGFLEFEYDITLTDDIFHQAWVDIELALENFYKNEIVWKLFREANRLIPQRPLSFKCAETTIRVVPDLIIFRGPRAPGILDWKVNTWPMRDYWLQLVTGAIALVRCTPHRDWSVDATKFAPQDIQLLEVQLLVGDTRPHTISETDILETEDFISISAMEMKLADVEDVSLDQRITKYQVAEDPKTCQTCQYKKLCWENEK